MNEHRLEKTVEFDADPEQVWEAIGTGPGIGTWFVPFTVEPRVGGAARGDFGGAFEGAGAVTAYEEGRRFAYGEPAGEERTMAFEFLVEARTGGGTVMRFVQSGFADTDWEGEYDSFSDGWDLFFLNLREYLAHFAGRPARNVVAMVMAPGAAAEIWPVLLRELGLGSRPELGDTVTLAPRDVPPVSGVVDVVDGKFLGVRSANGLHRIGAEGDSGCGVSAYHYFYDGESDAAALTEAWQGWLGRLFPAPVTA